MRTQAAVRLRWRRVPDIPLLIAAAGPLSVDGAVLFVKGTLVGVAVTAPPGPVGGLCIQRTLRGGLWPGLSTALGALIADAFYGALAAFGLAQIAVPHGPWREVLAVIVAAALTVLGVKYLRRAWRGEVEIEPAPEKTRFAGLAGLVLGTFLLTLTTPATLPAFVVMFASLGLAAESADCAGGPFLVVSGVVAGAAAWWFVLCGAVHRFRDHARGWIRGMEYACGLLLLIGAAGAIWSGFGG
jgi:putative LysE/RhtB family amino acid efflux pump